MLFTFCFFYSIICKKRKEREILTNYEFLHFDVSITADVTERRSVFEGENVTQFGICAKMIFRGTVVLDCLINDISTDKSFVLRIARTIETERITPAEVKYYIEDELSKQ